MTMLLQVAAFLAVALGVTHSVLGEVYVLQRLFRRGDLPTLLGGPEYMKRTLRFAWHLTSVAWVGFGGLLLYMTDALMTYRSVAYVIGLTFMTSALLTAIGSRGRHLAWLPMTYIGVVALVLART